MSLSERVFFALLTSLLVIVVWGFLHYASQANCPAGSPLTTTQTTALMKGMK